MMNRMHSDGTNRRRLAVSADGWRGVIGETFSSSTAAEIAYQVVCAVSAQRAVRRALVTYDCRRGGREAAAAVAEAAHRAGAGKVTVMAHVPTPTATYAVRAGDVDLALLVTASHNPAHWNGIKVKVPPGCSMNTRLEERVEAAPPWQPGTGPGAVEVGEGDREALLERHRRFVLTNAGLPRGRSGSDRQHVVVDGLHGIAGHPTDRLCRSLGWTTRVLGSRHQSDFDGIVPDPSLPQSCARAMREVLTTQADLGVVVDGDGDRVYVLDHCGDTVLPHELFALLLLWRGSAGPGERVAVTVATGSTAVRVARNLGYQVIERPVGFKYMSELFAEASVAAACGGVGDLAFTEHGFDRDPFAILVALSQLLADSGSSLHELVTDLRGTGPRLRWFERHVTGEIGANRLAETGRQALATLSWVPRESTEVDGVKFWLHDNQWVLLRRSTTEGGVRIYGELEEDRKTSSRIAQLTSVVDSLVGAQDTVGEC